MLAHTKTSLLRRGLGSSALAGHLLALLGALLTLSACGGGDSPFYAYEDPSDAPEPIRAAARAVVRISTPGSYATGSFISGDGTLLTNNHVLGVSICSRGGCFTKLSLSYERGEPFKPAVPVFVQPLAVDVGLDMAAVQVFSLDESGKPAGKFEAPGVLSFQSHDAASLVSTHVNVVGHPHGTLKKWSQGDVTDSVGLWFYSTATSLPGNSGSPCLDDQGKIVGLLHRGPRDPGLITEDGANLYSLGTASAPIMAALSAPLPDTVVSLDAPASEDEVVARQALYFNAHVPIANLEGGMTRPVLTLLGEACDKGLVRDDYLSPEDLQAGLEPCADALNWINCVKDASTTSFAVCPTGAEKDAWAARFLGAFEKQRAFNGGLWLTMVSFGPAALDGTPAGQVSLNKALDEARPPMSFLLADYLAAFGITTYHGANVVDYILSYKNVPHYELSVSTIVYAALWANNKNLMTGTQMKSLLEDLADDDRLDLNDKLLVEAERYEGAEIE